MSEKLMNILIVDDDRIDQKRLKRALNKLLSQETEFAFQSVEVMSDALEMLKTNYFDLILLDLRLPDSCGIASVETIHQLYPSIPIIVLTGSQDEKLGAETIKKGAIDYISKSFEQSVFETRIGIALQIFNLQKKLIQLANKDELTGLDNRRCLLNILNHEINRTKIKGYALTLMLFDIDHFKSINDLYGHLAGDEVLKQMGQIIQENIYPMDTAARYGGEEFIVLMPETSPERALQAANRLHKIIDRYQWKVSDKTVSITASIGLVTLSSNNLTDSHEMIEKADEALYAAKKQGRNRVVCYGNIDYNQQPKTPDDRLYKELQNKVISLRSQLRSYTLGAVSSFTKAMDLIQKDPQRLQHAENIRKYAIFIADEMDLSDELKEKVGIAALLQDIGTITIPSEILNKTEPLTDQEMQIIRNHIVAGVEILEPLGVFNLELQIIRHHHERFDGSGYPNGLKGREIPIGSRILAVADAFDAMISDRCYRPTKPYEEALSEIIDCSGKQFDPDVVGAFQRMFEKHKLEFKQKQEQ